MSGWRVTVHPLAHDDMWRLKKRYPEAFTEMMQAFETLQSCDSPFDVSAPLNVVRMYPDAPRCLRFKRNRGQWRVVMRIMRKDVQIKPHEGLRPSDDMYLQILFVDVRSNRTYEDVRLRIRDIF